MSPFVLVHSSCSSRIESKLIKSSHHLKKLAIGRVSRTQAGPRRGNHKPPPIMATTPTLASPPMTRAISASLKRIGLIILLLAIIHLDGQQSTVRCQDFEDLNNNNNNNNNNNKYAANNNGGGANQQAAFQPSRQSSSTSSTSNSPFQGASNLRQSFQRPVLSNRFAQQQLSAQASTISNTVVSGQQQQQQTLPTTTSQQQQATSQPAPSNIEQIMKNALARTNRFEQAGGDAAESRQDQNSEPIQSRSGAQFQSSSSSSSSRTTPAASANTASAQDSSEGQTNTQAADEQDKQTTAAAQAGTTNGHDTVYSDQRFANLFARRGNQKKTKFTPTEQVRAKPTLPSFIKSPPDPKQFSASAVDSQDRPITPASANLISVRLQQQQSNQNRQSVSSQKKPVAAITSNTAANANNKRLNSQKQQTTAASVSPKASSGSRANGSQANANVTNRPASNNPFNKPQQNSNDPANVIAMARRRLLANNANNQQQQQRPVAN